LVEVETGEVEAEDPFALRVEGTRRDETEALVEAVWPAVPDHVAGEQLSRALGTDQLDDTLDDRPTDATSLVTLVHDELPWES
jgi:hypothetical protein